MGYQIVDIDLCNGKKLLERIVLNSEFLRLEDNETIDPLDIAAIHLHRDQPPLHGHSDSYLYQ